VREDDERHRLDGGLAGGVTGVGRQDPAEHRGGEVDDRARRASPELSTDVLRRVIDINLIGCFLTPSLPT
jgi:hypothetical protein